MKIVVTAAVIVVLAGAFALSYSPPLYEKFHKAKDEWGEWTAKRVKENTSEYLNFCKRKAVESISTLEVRQIEIRQKTADFTHKRDTSRFLVTQASPKLDSLKEKYRKAEASGEWPILWEDLSLAKPHAQRHIIVTHKQIEANRYIADTCENAVEKLNEQHDRIFEAIADAEAKLIEIETSEQILAIRSLSGELEEDLLKLKDSIKSVEFIAADTSPAFKSIEELSGGSGFSASDQTFEAIMGMDKPAQEARAEG